MSDQIRQFNRDFHRLSSRPGEHGPNYIRALERMIKDFLVSTGEFNPNVFEDDKLRSDRMKKLMKRWNMDADPNNKTSVIHRDIRRRGRHTTEPYDTIMDSWSIYVWQELSMWVQLGKPVSYDEISTMTKHRGFTKTQEQYIIDMLNYLGLHPFEKDEKDEAVLHHVPGKSRGLGLMVDAKQPRILHKTRRGRAVL